MELECVLKKLQGFIDLETVNSKCRIRGRNSSTWSSLVVSISSSMFSSGSRLMAENGGCELQVSAAREDAQCRKCLP